MALSLENINLVKQRTRWEVRKPGVSELFRALWKHMESKGNPDLQLVAFDQTGNADSVIADAACKVYAVYFKKPSTSTTAAWLKLSDGTSVAADGDIVVKLAAAAAALKEGALIFPDGVDFGTACEIASHTTVNGSSHSVDADASAGFVIVGAA